MSAFLIFFGRGGSSDIERQLDTVKLAIGGVVLARAADAGVNRLYAVTNDNEAAAVFRGKGAAILPARTEPFHFGQELSRIVPPHPTASEAVLDAARAVDGWAIHA